MTWCDLLSKKKEREKRVYEARKESIPLVMASDSARRAQEVGRCFDCEEPDALWQLEPRTLRSGTRAVNTHWAGGGLSAGMRPC